MSQSMPEFHLKRVLADGSSSEPEIYPVYAPPMGLSTSRRGFLGTGVAATAALTILSGCGQEPQPREPSAYAEKVNSLAVSSDGTMLVSEGSEGSVKLWSLPERKLLKTIPGRLPVLDSTGNTLATVDDEAVKFWSVPNGDLLQALPCPKDAIKALTLSSDGKYLAARLNDELKIWSRLDGKPVPSPVAKDSAYALASSPIGTVLATVSKGDKDVQLWSLSKNELIATVPTEREAPEYDLLVAPTRNQLVVIRKNYGEMSVVSLTNGKPIDTPRRLDKHKAEFSVYKSGEVFLFALSSDEKFLLGRGKDFLACWDFPSGYARDCLEKYGKKGSRQEFDFVETNRNQVILAVSPDNKCVVTGNVNGVVLWPLSRDSPARVLKTMNMVTALAITPDSKFLVTGHHVGAILLWDLTSGESSLGEFIDPSVTRPAKFRAGQGFNWMSSSVESSGGSRSSSGTSDRVCTCNKVCTCNLVRR